MRRHLLAFYKVAKQRDNAPVRMWKKLTHKPRFPTCAVKPRSYGDKTQMFLRSRSFAFFPTWLLTQLPTQFLEFDRFRTLSWIRSFLATNGKGYDNSRLSDDIHRVHDRFTTNGYALPAPHVLNHKKYLEWKPRPNLYKKNSHLFYVK